MFRRENQESSGPALALAVCWLGIVAIDLISGSAPWTGISLAVVMLISFITLSKWRSSFIFGTASRLILILPLAWGIFISYGLIDAHLLKYFSDRHFFLVKSFLSWPSAIASTITIAIPLFAMWIVQKGAVLMIMAAAGLAALLSIGVQSGPRFHPVSESLFMFVFMSIVAAAAQRHRIAESN